MMVLDKVVDQLQVYNTDFVFMEEDGVYTTTVLVGNFELLIELVLDESDGLVLVSGTLFLGTEPIHTHTYVDDNYEQVLLMLEKLIDKANNIVKALKEFSDC